MRIKFLSHPVSSITITFFPNIVQMTWRHNLRGYFLLVLFLAATAMQKVENDATIEREKKPNIR